MNKKLKGGSNSSRKYIRNHFYLRISLVLSSIYLFNNAQKGLTYLSTGIFSDMTNKNLPESS